MDKINLSKIIKPQKPPIKIVRKPFNPLKNQELKLKNLDLILNGKITNPNKNNLDYSFFVANNLPYQNKLEHLSDYVNKLPECDWFGKFTCFGDCEIMIYNKYSVSFNHNTKRLKIKETIMNPFHRGEFFKKEKDNKKQLLSTDISINSLNSGLTYIYYKNSDINKLLYLKK